MLIRHRLFSYIAMNLGHGELIFIFCNQPIEEVDHYKYLGIIISNGSKRFSQHFRKPHGRSYGEYLHKTSSQRAAARINVYLQVFDTQIRPILGYTSEIWCQDILIEELERVPLKYLKPSSVSVKVHQLRQSWVKPVVSHSTWDTRTKWWNCGPD